MERETVPITVYLKKESSRIIYCMMCKTNLGFSLEGIPSLIIEGSNANANGAKEVKYPIKAKCRGRGSHNGQEWRCPALYIIQGLVE